MIQKVFVGIFLQLYGFKNGFVGNKYECVKVGGGKLGVRNWGGQRPLARAVPCSCSKLGRNNEVRVVASFCCWVVRPTYCAC